MYEVNYCKLLQTKSSFLACLYEVKGELLYTPDHLVHPQSSGFVSFG